MDWLINMSTKKIMLLSISLSASYWFLFYNTGETWKQSIQQKKTDYEVKSKELNKLKENIEEAKRYEALSKVLQKELDRVVVAIPYKDEDNNESRQLMKFLSTEVRGIGADLLNISTGKWVVYTGKNEGRQVSSDLKGHFEEITVNINLKCTFDQVMMFLSNLTRSDRIFTVKQFTLNPQGNVQSLKKDQSFFMSFNAVLKTFRYVPEAEGEDKKEEGV